MASKTKTVFICSECGYQSSKWLGKCPMCLKWNTFEEEVVEEKHSTRLSPNAHSEFSSAVLFKDIGMPEYIRAETGIGELDRVLGGGVVNGSVVLLSGEPGIGKSTLLMQLSGKIADEKERRVLYVSGEESAGQLKIRAERLGITGNGFYILTDAEVDIVMREIDRIKPKIVIVDSVQTLNDAELSSSSGSITQVRESTSKLIAKAKADDISMLLVGHINKEGGIAGPKVLEHMVDAVLYFEGERRFAHRIVRAVKNRFGSTNEIGVFEMTSEGLIEVPNPSEMLLCDRPKGVSGTCAVSVMEGSRPIIAELQALASPTAFTSPKRTSNGIEYNRLYLLLAVLEKRLGLRFSANDIYMNVIGGLHIDEPAADLATCMALISSILDKPVPDDLIAIGEIGLAGECRAVSDVDQRVSEAARLGFRRAVIPRRSAEKLSKIDGIKVLPIGSIYECVKLFDTEKM